MGLLGKFFTALIDPSKDSKNALKGAKGEAQGSLGLALFLPSDYVVIHNVTILTPRGTTQIDHVVVSPFGIHVIESKNIKGGVFGTEDQQNWTVTLGPRKFQILNPLIQNAAHIKALARSLGFPENVFHSVVFFWSDDCRLRTPMPECVITKGLCSYIRKAKNVVIDPAVVSTVVGKIQSLRLPPTAATDKAHVDWLKERFGKTPTTSDGQPTTRPVVAVNRFQKESGPATCSISADSTREDLLAFLGAILRREGRHPTQRDLLQKMKSLPREEVNKYRLAIQALESEGRIFIKDGAFLLTDDGGLKTKLNS